MKGSMGTSLIIKKIPGAKRISCSKCINYNSDNSCDAKPVFITEIGYDYWKNCDAFSLDVAYDTDENRYLVARARPIKLKKKKKKKKKKKLSEKIGNQNIVNSQKKNYKFTQNIYPTEKSSEELTYAKRGRTREERLSDAKAKKSALERQHKKEKEDNKKYEMLIAKIGQRYKVESLYTRHFSNSIDTLDFIDELENILENKDISESELVFIREHIYKKYNNK